MEEEKSSPALLEDAELSSSKCFRLRRLIKCLNCKNAIDIDNADSSKRNEHIKKNHNEKIATKSIEKKSHDEKLENKANGNNKSREVKSFLKGSVENSATMMSPLNGSGVDEYKAKLIDPNDKNLPKSETGLPTSYALSF
jgi:hypothetical protein